MWRKIDTRYAQPWPLQHCYDDFPLTILLSSNSSGGSRGCDASSTSRRDGHHSLLPPINVCECSSCYKEVIFGVGEQTNFMFQWPVHRKNDLQELVQPHIRSRCGRFRSSIASYPITSRCTFPRRNGTTQTREQVVYAAAACSPVPPPAPDIPRKCLSMRRAPLWAAKSINAVSLLISMPLLVRALGSPWRKTPRPSRYSVSCWRNISTWVLLGPRLSIRPTRRFGPIPTLTGSAPYREWGLFSHSRFWQKPGTCAGFRITTIPQVLRVRSQPAAVRTVSWDLFQAFRQFQKHETIINQDPNDFM